MINIYDIDFRRADLNLLIVFASLMKERSVTRAAEKLSLSQGAVSAALGRLRRQFCDDLFVRSGQAMEPTPRAVELSRQIDPALRALHGAIAGAGHFDPTQEERVFTLGMSDDLEAFLLPKLAAHTHTRANPKLRFVVRQANRSVITDMIDLGEIDLGIAASAMGNADHRQQPLFTSSYACLFDPEQLDLSLPLGLQDYLDHPHVLVSRDARRGVVDDVLEAQSLTRQVITATTHFAGAAMLLTSIPAICTLPRHAALEFARACNLAVSPPPVPMPDFAVSALWHASLTSDPAHTWLRQTVIDLSASPNAG